MPEFIIGMAGFTAFIIGLSYFNVWWDEKRLQKKDDDDDVWRGESRL